MISHYLKGCYSSVGVETVDLRSNITKVIRVSKMEIAIVALLVILYLYAMYVRISTIFVFWYSFGGWLVFRPSERAVEGLEGISKTIGLTAYFVGVLTSLTSNFTRSSNI